MTYQLLVIDDDPLFLEMMQGLLAGDGFQTELCPSGALAHDLARSSRPDVITLDLRMPDRSGWEVLQSIKADPDLAAVPVFVISAAGAELAETTERLRELGYPRVEALAKPFELDALLSRLAHAALSVRDHLPS